MLILTRKTGDTIRIAPDIELIVVGIRHSEVVLGLKAPRDVKILRGELRETASQNSGGNSSTPVEFVEGVTEVHEEAREP